MPMTDANDILSLFLFNNQYLRARAHNHAKIMNKRNRLFKIFSVIIPALLILVTVFSIPMSVKAKDLDEIVNYEVTIDVNEDGTLHMLYHIDWKVLDSTSEGPLSWVVIGTPNKHLNSVTSNASCIKKIQYTTSKGSGVRIDLDRDYKKDEIVPMEFILEQDYMYTMNKLTDGETVYEFTPGWFDDVVVDKLTIKWNKDKVEAASPAYIVDRDP